MKIHCNVINVQSLLDVFPDAQIVMGHRDPLELVPSCTSFVHSISKLMTENVNAFYLAQVQNWSNARAGIQFIRQREAVLEQRKRDGMPVDNVFIDIAYKDLVQDTMRTLRKLYTDLDLSFSQSVKETMNTWLKNNPQDKHGRHVYSLEQFRLTEEEVNREWKEYTEYFKKYI